jgi:hypothetical protein
MKRQLNDRFKLGNNRSATNYLYFTYKNVGHCVLLDLFDSLLTLA